MLRAGLFKTRPVSRPKQIDPLRTFAWRHAMTDRNYMSNGTVKWFNATKGYGFIQPEDGGADVFVHISDVERAGIKNLREGDKLSYELMQGQRGKVSATNLKLGG
jgi:CspA family cold shock protein